jgi:hypothetical protein
MGPLPRKMIGPASSLGEFPIPQVQQSPVKFDTVRRMLDTGLTGPSAPRNFHANLVTLSMHYEF